MTMRRSTGVVVRLGAVAFAALVLLSEETLGAHGSPARTRCLPAPAQQPVPPPNRTNRETKAITNFERYLRERYDTSVQDIYEIGAIADEQFDVRFSVVHAYEPCRAVGHEKEAMAMRIDLRTRHGAEQFGHGWLDFHELALLATALPGMPSMETVPVNGATDRYIQVTFPRGGVVLGFHLVAGTAEQRRLFIRVGGADAVTAFLESERFSELEALVTAANQKVQELSKRGHHH